MTAEAAVVFIVDDDPAICRALTRLLRAAGFAARSFLSPQEFLETHDPATPGCVILDVALPGLNGLELQEALATSGCARSIIFITGQGDIPMSVRAMKAGAVDFLTKPVDDKLLLAAIRTAIDRDRLARRARADSEFVAQRLATLTHREREVLEHVVAGQLNKEIARDLGTVEKTIKVHRARVMAKMGVQTLADLVRVAERIGIAPGAEQRADGVQSSAM
jgi:FixJ family two-component response regulator